MILSGEGSARAWFKALPEWNADAKERLENLAALLTVENGLQNLVSEASSLNCGSVITQTRPSCSILFYVKLAPPGSILGLVPDFRESSWQSFALTAKCAWSNRAVGGLIGCSVPSRRWTLRMPRYAE